MQIVIVGAGQAGFSLAAKLRRLDFDGNITMIGEEPSPPYQRPPLSKAYLKGEMGLDRLMLRAEDFYEAQRIDLRLGETVRTLDPSEKKVVTDRGTLHYDQLVLATGAAPVRLPAAIGGDLPGLHTIRTIADIDGLAPALSAGRRLLIVGGGYIGLEAAAVAAEKHMRVTVIEQAERILQRVAAVETADYFRALHQCHGVEIVESAGLERLQQQADGIAATLSNGATIIVDVVIVGIGIRPNTQLAEAAGLAIDNGIKTDAFGQTSHPNIWAAGDCASFPYGDARIRLESVPHAMAHGEAVAANIVSANQAYRAEPWFWSDQYDVKLQIVGLNKGYDQVLKRPGDKPLAVSYWYYQGERLLAVDALNQPREYMLARRMLAAGKSPPHTLVTDATSDLKSYLKA